MHARFRGQNKPDFPSLADKKAEPRPDMNIKVAAFTVREKLLFTLITLNSLCATPLHIFFILLTCIIPFVSMYLQAGWKRQCGYKSDNSVRS